MIISKLDNQTVYEGRISHNTTMKLLYHGEWPRCFDKSIGDTVMVKAGDATHPYLITGLSQSISNMGQAAYLTLSGIQQVIPAIQAL